MEIRVKFPDNIDAVDIQPYKVEEYDKKIVEIGYKVQCNKKLVSIEKKDGYLYVVIDEREVDSVEKFE